MSRPYRSKTAVDTASENDLTDRESLQLAPAGLRAFIRCAGYRRGEYLHELVTEIYSLLMSRGRRGQIRQPAWLDDELYARRPSSVAPILAAWGWALRSTIPSHGG